ncbi:intraflagellar transport protein 20 homolog isoform 1-T1 [Chlamydotis macqueenii]
MAQAALGAAGLHFDELNKLRVLEPGVAEQTAQLREECRDFLGKIVEFQKIVGSLIELVDQLAKAAESEKMKVQCGESLACHVLCSLLCVKNPIPPFLLQLHKQSFCVPLSVAIGARNLLKSIAKQREAQEQQLQALISEKKIQLERYRIEYETLCKIEADQNEFIDQFIFQK